MVRSVYIRSKIVIKVPKEHATLISFYGVLLFLFVYVDKDCTCCVFLEQDVKR